MERLDRLRIPHVSGKYIPKEVWDGQRKIEEISCNDGRIIGAEPCTCKQEEEEKLFIEKKFLLFNFALFINKL